MTQNFKNKTNIRISSLIHEIDAWQENRDCKRHSSIPLKTNPSRPKFILVGQNIIEHHTVVIPGHFHINKMNFIFSKNEFVFKFWNYYFSIIYYNIVIW
jgi:hypothetical protein